ncbi:MAG: 8-oxoguanine DNA glycosylase [Geobacter sp.]|nr:8-oxoguanine DNA glycosylase [Geobacter sp.]
MSQTALAIINGTLEELELPSPGTEVIPNVLWGKFDELFTPAYWLVQSWQDKSSNRYAHYKLGNSLIEEVAACLLGGHGIPSEVGGAAYDLVKSRGMLTGAAVGYEELAKTLHEPLKVKGKIIHYRFWNQKAKYLSKAIEILSTKAPEFEHHRDLRNWLSANIPGIGPKTASWITRNWLESDEVAIIDIHINRAGLLAGFFEKGLSVEKHYFQMEDRFLAFAQSIGVRASILDNLIWRQMKDLNMLGIASTRQTEVTRRKSTATKHPHSNQPNLFH